ncbi:unnamed protein product, partial [Phaeothamnion confervicola]
MSPSRLQFLLVSSLLLSERFRLGLCGARPGGWDIPSSDWKNLGKVEEKRAGEDPVPPPPHTAANEDNSMAQFLKEMEAKKEQQAAAERKSEPPASSVGIKGGNPKALFLQLSKLSLLLGVGYIGVRRVIELIQKIEKERSEKKDG